MTLAEFIAKHQITATAARVDENPNAKDAWPADARHFRVTLRSTFDGDRAAQFYFSQGSAHTEDPTAADLLDCLASDAHLQEEYPGPVELVVGLGGTIETQADLDKAHRDWKATTRNTSELRYVLGGDSALQALMYDTERQ